jgi:hypothetical protein
MIMGECPYDDCDDFQMRILPEVDLPKFSKETCPGCGRRIWVLYSRVDPMIFTETGFSERYTVDEETKHIAEKKTPAA